MKKAVFYIPGFDPRGKNFYKRFFRNEMNKYSRVTNTESQNKFGKESKWNIKTQSVETDIFFVCWIQIINAVYQQGRLKSWLNIVVSCTMTLCNRKCFVNLKSYTYQLIFVLLPVLELFIYMLVVTFLLIVLLFFGLKVFLFCLFVFIILNIVYTALRSKVFSDKLRVWVQNFISLVIVSKAREKAFRDVAKKWKDNIVECIECGDYDEVIVISHSAGGYILLYLLDEFPEEYIGKIKVVTMGQCIANYINFSHFRSSKQKIVGFLKDKKLFWLDVYGTADGVSSKINIDEDLNNAGMTSMNANLSKMYSDKDYRKVKENPLLLHFQYLASGDIPVNRLNFYKILTSPKLLKNYN